MTAPYSVDLRQRALARKEAGETNREIAAALRISPSSVSKWTKRKRETGSLAPAQIGGYKPPHALGRLRRLAAGAHRRRAVHIARLVSRVGRTGDQDASAGGVGVRSRRGAKAGAMEGPSAPDRALCGHRVVTARHYERNHKNAPVAINNYRSIIYGWSGQQDSNLRPEVPKTSALPGCAIPRNAVKPLGSLGFSGSAVA
jgi:transposase